MRPPDDFLQNLADQQDDILGPMPPTAEELARAEQEGSTVADEIEERARAAKERLTAPEGPTERETWMTELPERYRKNFGAGARTFKTKAGNPIDEDQSGWTETPKDRARKALDKLRGKVPAAKQGPNREQAQQQQKVQDAVAAHNATKRPASLLDMHAKKRKKELKEEAKGGPKLREGWDRDRDMKSGLMDPKKRGEMMKQAAGLASRFAASQ